MISDLFDNRNSYDKYETSHLTADEYSNVTRNDTFETETY